MPRRRILIVEHDAAAACELDRALTLLGYERAGQTGEGAQAVALAGHLQPDLVLINVDLAGRLDGSSTAQAIHRQYDIPVVLMIDSAEEATLTRAQAGKPCGYIVRPFQNQALHVAIEMAIHSHRADTEVTTERRRAERGLRESEEFGRAILNSVAAHIAVIDSHGVIVAVNEPWKRFALENGPAGGGPAQRTGVGVNYLDVCRESTGDSSQGAQAADDGIRRVLAGRLPSFTLEYSCHSPDQQRWFTMTVTPLPSLDRGVVVSHFDITERKRTEGQIQQQLDELRRWHKVTLGREHRILELKAEVNELLVRLGEPPRYGQSVDDTGDLTSDDQARPTAMPEEDKP